MKNQKIVSLLFTILFLLLTVIMTFPGKAAAQDIDVSGVYRDYFKNRGVNYDAARLKIGEKNAVLASYISSRTNIDIDEVVKFSVKSSYDWNKVMLHYNVKPSSLFLPVPTGYKVGPPYGKAYGYWKKYRANPSCKINLSTDDIYNLVNLGIVHKLYNTPVTDVMKLRAANRSFKWIINDKHKKYKAKVKVKTSNKNKAKNKGQSKKKKNK